MLARLAGDLGHELRNPLNALSLTFQLLERVLEREGVKEGVKEGVGVEALIERRADVVRHVRNGAAEVEKIERAVAAFLARAQAGAGADMDAAPGAAAAPPRREAAT